MKRKENRKGFTLAELLIVVAIIAVLVAISIPIFSSQLKKARLAVDQANVRSAKSAAAAEYMTDGEDGDVSYIYDGSRAIKIGSSTDLVSLLSKQGYGKSEAKDNQPKNGTFPTGASGTPKNSYVEVTVKDSDQEQITAFWVSNFTMKGTVSASNLKKQVEDKGMNVEDVVVFTAESGTKLDSNSLGSGETLANLFEGFDNLRTIDLSNATLGLGNVDLFQSVPKTVNEIDLPQCASSYDIRGKWYYADGSSFYPNKTGSGANTDDTRITQEDIKAHGRKIYKDPPTEKQNREAKNYN